MRVMDAFLPALGGKFFILGDTQIEAWAFSFQRCWGGAQGSQRLAAEPAHPKDSFQLWGLSGSLFYCCEET